MWPIYMGLQVLKSLLFALFLPTIIGSVSRLIGKGKFCFIFLSPGQYVMATFAQYINRYHLRLGQLNSALCSSHGGATGVGLQGQQR